MAERHEIVFSGAFAGGGGGAAGGDTPGVESDDAKKFNKMKDEMKNAGGAFWKKIGIDVSLRSLLKQSQIFTSVIGGFFQIVGGFIDIVLAPFIPFIIPIMKKLSSLMPKVMEFSQHVGKAVGWIVKIIGAVFRGLDGILGNVISRSLAPLAGFGGFMFTIIGLLSLMSKSFRSMLGRGARGGFNMMTGGGGRAGQARGLFSGGSYMGRGGGAPIGLMRGMGGAGMAMVGLGSIAGGVGQMRSGQKGMGAMQMAGGGLMAAGGVAAMTGVGMPIALGLMAVGGILSMVAQTSKENTEALKSNTNATTIYVETHNATLAVDLRREGLQSIDDSPFDVTVKRGQ